MDPQAYLKSKELDSRCEWVASTFGIHPWNAPAYHADLHVLDELIAQSPMVGEIGLDYHFITDPVQHEAQRHVFRYFVQKGVAQDKILNIHSKGAEADVNTILGDLSVRRAILHWYSGPIDTLQELAEKGFYFSLGVEMLSDPHIQLVARTVPAELLLTETDSPGGYKWLTGTTIGTPALIRSVVAKLSGNEFPYGPSAVGETSGFAQNQGSSPNASLQQLLPKRPSLSQKMALDAATAAR